MIPVIRICLWLTASVSHNTCINKCLFIICKRSIIIGKIHQKGLWKFSLIRCIHCFHIIFIYPCQTDPFLHCQGKPSEIFRFSRISKHDISADCFQRIIGFKSIVSHCQCSVHTGTKFSLIPCEIGKSHHQLFCQKTFLSRK